MSTKSLLVAGLATLALGTSAQAGDWGYNPQPWGGKYNPPPKHVFYPPPKQDGHKFPPIQHPGQVRPGPFNQQVLGVAFGAGFVGSQSRAATETRGVGSVGVATNAVQTFGTGAGTVNTCATCTGQQGGPGQVTGSALGQASGQQVTAATSIGNSSSTPTSASANAHLSGFGAGIGGGLIGRR